MVKHKQKNGPYTWPLSLRVVLLALFIFVKVNARSITSTVPETFCGKFWEKHTIPLWPRNEHHAYCRTCCDSMHKEILSYHGLHHRFCPLPRQFWKSFVENSQDFTKILSLHYRKLWPLLRLLKWFAVKLRNFEAVPFEVKTLIRLFLTKSSKKF